MRKQMNMRPFSVLCSKGIRTEIRSNNTVSYSNINFLRSTMFSKSIYQCGQLGQKRYMKQLQKMHKAYMPFSEIVPYNYRRFRRFSVNGIVNRRKFKDILVNRN